MKCHSKRSDSRGEAWRSGEGLRDSSRASRRMRFMVGFLVLNCPCVDMLGLRSWGGGRKGFEVVTVLKED